MTRLLRALPPQFALIVPATVILYLVSPLLAEGSVSGSSILIVFSFASILAIAAIGQTLVIQQGGLDLSVPGVISLAAVLVTKYPDGDNSALVPLDCRRDRVRLSVRADLRNRHHALSRHARWSRRSPSMRCFTARCSISRRVRRPRRCRRC